MRRHSVLTALAAAPGLADPASARPAWPPRTVRMVSSSPPAA